MPISLLTRRQFLRNSVAAGVAAALPHELWATGGAASHLPNDHIALLSDVHVSGRGSGSMAERLTQAVGEVLAQRAKPDKVLVAGDCAHLRGRADDYRAFVRLMRPIVDADVPLHLTLGNHDDRDNFWNALPNERAEVTGLSRQASIVPGRHANWFLLDSLYKTNKSAGELGRDQLDWLEAALDERADKPAIIMLHHNPDRPGDSSSLRDCDALYAILRPRRHVKAMFFGHSHVWAVTKDRSGMFLVNLPATGYTLWFRSFTGWVDCRVQDNGATLHVHTLKPNKKENGLKVNLHWR